MPKVQESGGCLKITVPSDIAEGKGWKKGTDLGFVIVDDINRPLPGDIYLRKNR